MREFPAQFAAVAETAAFALTFCGSHGIDRQSAQRVRLVIEELFTNSIQHGYGGECEALIRIELAMIDGYLTVQYTDSAPPHDPLMRMSMPAADRAEDHDGPPSDGLGIYLIGKLVHSARYSYEDGHNRLRLVMPR